MKLIIVSIQLTCSVVFCCRHECPCCKAELNADDIILDTGFDALIRMFHTHREGEGERETYITRHSVNFLGAVRTERAAAEKEYFKQIVEEGTPYIHL